MTAEGAVSAIIGSPRPDRAVADLPSAREAGLTHADHRCPCRHRGHGARQRDLRPDRHRQRDHRDGRDGPQTSRTAASPRTWGDRRVPHRQGPARDRGPLREALPGHVLGGRSAPRGRPERGRHRPVGHQGPVLRGADLPAARRADAARRSSPYAHVACGASPEEFVANLRRLVDRGYRAAKTGLPLFYGEKAAPKASRAAATSGRPGRSGRRSRRPSTCRRTSRRIARLVRRGARRRSAASSS